jgi:hypothetical protein
VTPKVAQCSIRRTAPRGPMKGCEDLDCFKECVAETRREREEWG